MLILGMITAFSACSPIVAPAYIDYQVEKKEGSVQERLERAFKTQGWIVSHHDDVLGTDEKMIQDLAVYKLFVSFEVLPMGENQVRLLIHAFRKYRLSGTRSKIPYLERHIKSAAVKPLQEALKQEGFEILGMKEKEKGAKIRQ